MVVANTFGFALIRNPDFRWWIGPQVRVGFHSGEVDTDPLTDYELVSFGLGAVTGFNFMAGNVCISPSLGILTTGFAGETDSPDFDEEFEGAITTAFLNIAVLFGK